MSRGPIYINFIHQGKSHTKFGFDVLFDFGVALWFLIQELTAREGYNLETLIRIVLVELYQRQVVFLGKGSLAGHVHNDGHLFSNHEILHYFWIHVDVGHL
jgi:hypothetical protein